MCVTSRDLPCDLGVYLAEVEGDLEGPTPPSRRAAFLSHGYTHASPKATPTPGHAKEGGHHSREGQLSAHQTREAREGARAAGLAHAAAASGGAGGGDGEGESSLCLAFLDASLGASPCVSPCSRGAADSARAGGSVPAISLGS